MRAFTFSMLIFVCSIVHLNQTYAQRMDYLITKGGDTLKGRFDGKKFQADNWDKARKLDVNDYKEMYNAHENMLSRFVAVRGSAHPVFMRMLERGKIRLYDVEPTGGIYFRAGQWYSNSSPMRLYVAKENDSVTELQYTSPAMLDFKSRRTRMKLLAEMLSDNKEVYEKFINEGKFNSEQVRNIVHLYNTGRSFESDIPRDYLIKKNKDTVFCEIEPATINTMGRYRVNPKDRFIRIDTTIVEYFLAKSTSTYLLKSLPNTKYKEYIKLLISGKINLYSFSINSVNDTEASLYASKEAGGLVQIKHAFAGRSAKEIKAFTDMISDDPPICEKFKGLPYNFTSIFDCIKEYDSKY